jgi:hypothetical protein
MSCAAKISATGRMNVSTRELQEWMGHADAKTTARYTHYRSRGGEAARLAPAFQTAALQTELQASDVREPSAAFRAVQPDEEETPAQAAVLWNGTAGARTS